MDRKSNWEHLEHYNWIFDWYEFLYRFPRWNMNTLYSVYIADTQKQAI